MEFKAARKRLKIRQPDVARIIGVSYRSYCDWEAGKVTPYAIAVEGGLARLAAIKNWKAARDIVQSWEPEE